MAGVSFVVGLSGSRRLEVVATSSPSSSSSSGLFLCREPANRSFLWSWESTWLSSMLDLVEEGRWASLRLRDLPETLLEPAARAVFGDGGVHRAAAAFLAVGLPLPLGHPSAKDSDAGAVRLVGICS